MKGTITTAEAAHYAEVEPATIRQWVARGHLIPVGKRGRQLLFRLVDITRVEVQTYRADRTGRATR